MLVVLLVVSAAGLLYWLKGSRPAANPSPPNAETKSQSPYVDPKEWLAAKNVAIATSSQSDERAARLLPMKGSENVSNLLVRPKLVAEPTMDLGPREDVEWVIDMPAGHDGVLKRAQVLSILDGDWLDKNERPTLYGRAVADKRWTYVLAGGAPNPYDQLALGFALEPLAVRSVSESRLAEIERTAEDAAKRLGASGAKARSSAHAALERARSLEAIHRKFDDARAVVLLAAPEGTTFDGKKVWDVMMSLGLHWGDMDEFHWENDAHASGDDHLFSVSTSMDPGYFLPEEIAADRVHVGNLLFDFSIPRSVEPRTVLEGMLAAATYAQKRLGGELVDGEGADLKPDVLRKRVADTAAALTQAGFPPGAGGTLRIF